MASEGLYDQDGKPVVTPVFKTDRATYFGDVSAHLANLVIQQLGYKARGEKPGLLGRASIRLAKFGGLSGKQSWPEQWHARQRFRENPGKW